MHYGSVFLFIKYILVQFLGLFLTFQQDNNSSIFYSCIFPKLSTFKLWLTAHILWALHYPIWQEIKYKWRKPEIQTAQILMGLRKKRKERKAIKRYLIYFLCPSIYLKTMQLEKHSGWNLLNKSAIWPWDFKTYEIMYVYVYSVQFNKLQYGTSKKNDIKEWHQWRYLQISMTQSFTFGIWRMLNSHSEDFQWYSCKF